MTVKTTLPIADRVKDLIERELFHINRDELTRDAHFVEDLGADSLDVIEITMAAEQAFGIDIPDEDADQLTTVGSFIAYLERRASEMRA